MARRHEGQRLITDPWFSAVAIPALLPMGLSKSGFDAGFGARAAPLRALAVPVPQAAAIMLPRWLVMDGFAVKALFLQRAPALIRLLLPAGLLGTVLGTLSFGVLAPEVVTGIVGALTLAFLAQRLLFRPRADSTLPPKWLGIGLGIASGFTSFVAHAGSPPVSACVLPLRLAPITYTAAMATFFAAINLSNWPPDAWFGLIDVRNITTSLVLVPLAPEAPVGVWVGVKRVPHIGPVPFYRGVHAGMFLTGAKLLWDGLK
ncbi:MAG: sulfite exporter TauE/SafE family protein [Bacteriovorax sp.]|nr:sulfite exporter TauE/SafE family protein [Rhizobacter sp.]